MINTVFDNNSSDNSLDYVIENNFSRIGIIYNPTITSSVTNTGTTLGALKLTPSTSNSADSISDTTYAVNSRITQTVSTGVTATAYVASWDSNNGILRYYQPAGISTFTNNKLNRFSYTGEESSDTIFGSSGGNSLVIDNFTGNSIINSNTGITIPLGVEFVNGLAGSEIQPKYSGDVIYVDNRASVPRSQNQKEDIKIVLEF